jgi:hypothetical protein
MVVFAGPRWTGLNARIRWFRPDGADLWPACIFGNNFESGVVNVAGGRP